MSFILSILEKHIKYYSQWDFLIFTILTSISILNGTTTVFYIIYFFWFNELIRIIIDRIFLNINPNTIIGSHKQAAIIPSFLQMGVYFIFIVVFFGFMANWKNQELILNNMSILFFKNWFFNINLAFVVFERIVIHKTQQPVFVSFGNFTPNMLVLHVSIILGAIIMLFIVRNFPETFTPSNLWGSAIIIFPFLILKAFIAYFSDRK